MKQPIELWDEARGVVRVVERLPSMDEAPSLISSTTQTWHADAHPADRRWGQRDKKIKIILSYIATSWPAGDTGDPGRERKGWGL